MVEGVVEVGTNKGFCYNTILVVLAMVLTSSLIFTGCGKKSSPTPTPTTSTTPTSHAPVKIGAIYPLTGPLSSFGYSIVDPIIDLVEKQVKDQGGILGGREVNIVSQDSYSPVEPTSGAANAASRLFFESKVSVLTLGVTSLEEEPVGAFAEQNKVLYVTLNDTVSLENNPYMINGTYAITENDAVNLFVATNLLTNVKKAGILATDVQLNHIDAARYGEKLKSAGIDIVYETYVPQNVTDFTPYLAQIKHDKPDILFLDIDNAEACKGIALQIIDLGGWGDTRVVTYGGSEAVGLAGAEGWYVSVPWTQELTYPGAVKFKNDYQALFGSLPIPDMVYAYNPLWTAIQVIEQAETDTDLAKIAQFARSGKFGWDSAMGRAQYGTNGQSEITLTLTQIQNGRLVTIPFTP